MIKANNITGKGIYGLRRLKNKDKVAYCSTLSRPFSFWNNTGVACLRFAHVLGLNPIYLVGIDLNFRIKKHMAGLFICNLCNGKITGP